MLHFLLLLLWSNILTICVASKRGVGWGVPVSDDDVRALVGNGVVSWAYNWAWDDTHQALDTNLEFVPMIWSGTNIDQFPGHVIAKGYKTILGFNEPERTDQANMPPDVAANLWKTYIQPLKQRGIRLGAPAVSSAAAGKAWLLKFFASCSGCTFDFLPLHWYGQGPGVQYGFEGYIQDMYNTFHMPIWVTEYADTSSNKTEVLEVLKATMTWLDQQAFIERYSWFGAFRGNQTFCLLQPTGGLSDIGRAYIS